MPAINQTRITFPEPDRPTDEIESELAAVWKKALASEGLTPAEASAIVETWRKTWFRESGDRVFIIIPQKVTDEMLPLKITQAPERTERVFVARIEMVSPEREETLIRLLNSTQIPSEEELENSSAEIPDRFGTGTRDDHRKKQEEWSWQRVQSIVSPRKSVPAVVVLSLA